MTGRTSPKRGEVWLVDFSPAIGSEIKDLHPAMVVSVDELNSSLWGLAVVCPITTFRKRKHFRLHVLILPPDGGIKHNSILRCDQVKSVSINRFSTKWGTVTKETTRKVEFILKKVLGI